MKIWETRSTLHSHPQAAEFCLCLPDFLLNFSSQRVRELLRKRMQFEVTFMITVISIFARELNLASCNAEANFSIIMRIFPNSHIKFIFTNSNNFNHFMQTQRVFQDTFTFRNIYSFVSLPKLDNVTSGFKHVNFSNHHKHKKFTKHFLHAYMEDDLSSSGNNYGSLANILLRSKSTAGEWPDHYLFIHSFLFFSFFFSFHFH